MTNLTSIAGGAIWMAVSVLLTVAAVEPVDTKAPGATVEVAEACAAPACAARRA